MIYSKVIKRKLLIEKKGHTPVLDNRYLRYMSYEYPLPQISRYPYCVIKFENSYCEILIHPRDIVNFGLDFNGDCYIAKISAVFYDINIVNVIFHSNILKIIHLNFGGKIMQEDSCKLIEKNISRKSLFDNIPNFGVYAMAEQRFVSREVYKVEFSFIIR